MSGIVMRSISRCLSRVSYPPETLHFPAIKVNIPLLTITQTHCQQHQQPSCSNNDSITPLHHHGLVLARQDRLILLLYKTQLSIINHSRFRSSHTTHQNTNTNTCLPASRNTPLNPPANNNSPPPTYNLHNPSPAHPHKRTHPTITSTLFKHIQHHKFKETNNLPPLPPPLLTLRAHLYHPNSRPRQLPPLPHPPRSLALLVHSASSNTHRTHCAQKPNTLHPTRRHRRSRTRSLRQTSTAARRRSIALPATPASGTRARTGARVAAATGSV